MIKSLSRRMLWLRAKRFLRLDAVGLASFCIVPTAIVVSSPVAAQKPDEQICLRAEVHRYFQDAIKDASKKAFGSANPKWITESASMQQIHGDGVICNATVRYEYQQLGGGAASIEFANMQFLVRKGEGSRLNVVLYGGSRPRPGTDDKSREIDVPSDAKLASDADANAEVDAFRAWIDETAKKKNEHDREETRRRKVPCEQSGGTWGYHKGEIGCYFKTVG